MTSRLLRRGLLVVERIDDEAHALFLAPRLRLKWISDREVLERYAGIDGRLWPDDPAAAGLELERGLAPFGQIGRVRTYLRSLRPKVRCDLLVVEREPFGGSADRSELSFLGYDFGFLEGEHNVYSLLFQEVIYPRFEELSAFASCLNQNLLLDSVEATKEIAGIRDSLEARGERFETTDSPEVCDSIAVFAFAE